MPLPPAHPWRPLLTWPPRCSQACKQLLLVAEEESEPEEPDHRHHHLTVVLPSTDGFDRTSAGSAVVYDGEVLHLAAPGGSLLSASAAPVGPAAAAAASGPRISRLPVLRKPKRLRRSKGSMRVSLNVSCGFVSIAEEQEEAVAAI